MQKKTLINGLKITLAVLVIFFGLGSLVVDHPISTGLRIALCTTALLLSISLLPLPIYRKYKAGKFIKWIALVIFLVPFLQYSKIVGVIIKEEQRQEFIQDSIQQFKEDSIQAIEDSIQHVNDSIALEKRLKEDKKAARKKPSSYNPSGSSVQCRGYTKSGRRCRRSTKSINGYCYQHG